MAAPLNEWEQQLADIDKENEELVQEIVVLYAVRDNASNERYSLQLELEEIRKVMNEDEERGYQLSTSFSTMLNECGEYFYDKLCTFRDAMSGLYSAVYAYQCETSLFIQSQAIKKLKEYLDEVAISGNFEIYRQKIEIVMKELQEDQENMDRCQAEWTEFITELEMFRDKMCLFLMHYST